jgi:O-antigen ligase
MNYQIGLTRSPYLKSSGWLVLVGACLLAVVGALLISVLPALMVIVLIVAPLVLLFIWLKPEFSLVVLFATIFGALPLPSLPLGGGTLRAEDLGIPFFLAILLIKRYGEIRRRFAVISPYFMTLSLLGVAVIFSIFYSYFLGRQPIKDILNELRPYYYWCLIMVLPLAINDEKALPRFRAMVFWLAILLAIAVSAQSFFGIQLLQRGGFRQVITMDRVATGVIRSTTPGMYLLAGALIYLVAAYSMGARINKARMVVGAAALSVGLLVGFGRALWLSVALGILMLAIFSKSYRYFAFLITAIGCAVVVISILVTVRPGYIDAAERRLMSVGEEISYGGSFGRRKLEFFYAASAISRNPIFGVGLGSSYKPPTSDSSWWDVETRYIHNSYLSVLTKLGVFGLFPFLMFLFVAIRRGIRVFSSAGYDRPLVYAALWVILSVSTVTSITQPDLVSPHGVAVICLVVFLIETAGRSGSSRLNGVVDAENSSNFRVQPYRLKAPCKII